MKRTLALTFCVGLTACGGSGSNPTAPETPRMLQGQALNAVDGTAAGVVNIQIGSHLPVQSDTNGNFQVDVGGPGTYAAVVTGGPIVERHTSVTGPTAERTKLGLIPSEFDLQAFDEMFRSSNHRLQRWTSRPSLVIIATVMRYVSGDTEKYQATAERLTDDEVTALAANLAEGLTLLTAGTYTTFASVEIERPGQGEQVDVERVGKIVIGRYTGISTLAHTIGYGNWAEQPDGTVVGGTVWLDRDFDRDDARRRLLRMHELGHALGYSHVTVRTSIMNPAIGPEPTDFDRAGASIAFQRPVGNVSPDSDPSGGPRTLDLSEGAARWTTPVR
jgi:Matrixin